VDKLTVSADPALDGMTSVALPFSAARMSSQSPTQPAATASREPAIEVTTSRLFPSWLAAVKASLVRMA
jgi:hypothetical protein